MTANEKDEATFIIYIKIEQDPLNCNKLQKLEDAIGETQKT